MAVSLRAGRKGELAYIEHFGLQQAPFQTTPSPMFAFNSPSMIDGITQMRNVTVGRTGLGLVSGDVGYGKTTLARASEADLRSLAFDVAMFPAVPGNTRQTEASIIKDVAGRLELRKVRGNAADAYYNAIYEHALALDKRDRTVVVIIDDAQELKPTAIKTLLRLLSMQTLSSQLVQVLLFGQNPEMLVAVSNNRALHSRLAGHVELEPFADDEVGDMLLHRLKIAGRSKTIFTPDAVVAI